MACAPSHGLSTSSTFRGASQPAREDRGAFQGVFEEAEGAASSNSMLAVWSERHQQLTAITTGISGSNGDGDANSIAPQPGEATAAATPVPATQPPTFASSDYETPFCYMRETIRVITRIRCVSGAVVSIIARWLIVKRTRAGQHPEIFCHHISAFLNGPLDQRRHSGLESHIADLVRVARTSSPGWLVPWADLIRDARRGPPSSFVQVRGRRASSWPQKRRHLEKAVWKRRLGPRARRLLGGMRVGSNSRQRDVGFLSLEQRASLAGR